MKKQIKIRVKPNVESELIHLFDKAVDIWLCEEDEPGLMERLGYPDVGSTVCKNDAGDDCLVVFIGEDKYKVTVEKLLP
jgi:hypothetical protein